MKYRIGKDRFVPIIKSETGHSYFRDRDTNQIAIADQSGDYPDETDDGVLWLDLNEPPYKAITYRASDSTFEKVDYEINIIIDKNDPGQKKSSTVVNEFEYILVKKLFYDF